MTRLIAWIISLFLFRSRRRLAELPPMSRLACAEIDRATMKLRGHER